MLRSRAPFLVTVASTALWFGCASSPRDQNIGMDASGYEPPIFEAGASDADASDETSAGGSSGSGGTSGSTGTSGSGGGAGGSSGSGGTGSTGAGGTSVDGATDAISDAGAVG